MEESTEYELVSSGDDVNINEISSGKTNGKMKITHKIKGYPEIVMDESVKDYLYSCGKSSSGKLVITKRNYNRTDKPTRKGVLATFHTNIIPDYSQYWYYVSNDIDSKTGNPFTVYQTLRKKRKKNTSKKKKSPSKSSRKKSRGKGSKKKRRR